MRSIIRILNSKSLVYRLVKIWLVSCLCAVGILISSGAENSNETYISESFNQLELTPLEIKWIEDHPVVYYSDDVSWKPFVYLNRKNELEGISPEFLQHIRKLTGISFEFIPSETWDQVITRIKRKQITLALATIATPERDSFADFSEPYFRSKMAIVTRQGNSYIQQIDELYGKTVVAPTGYYAIDYLRTNHPQIKLKLVNTLEQAFAAVFNEEADAFLGTLAVAIYRLKNSRFTSLKISGTLDEMSEVRFMVAKGNMELVSIINKALNKISEQDKRRVINNWFGVEIEQGIDPSIIWKILLSSGLIIGFAILWITQLKREVLLRRDAEKKMAIAREEADKANRAKSDFLANMSHEIRTPMNAIFAFSELLYDTPLNEEQRQYLDSIKVGSSGLLHIINDVLEISKIEAGKINIEYRPTNILKLCDEVNQLFVVPMREKNIVFSVDIPSTCPETVIIDGNRLRQIMINVIGNAHKFTSKGFVKLKITVTPTSIESKIDLRIEVSDTGVGIEKERQAFVFDHFVQNKIARDNPLGGTGLGLSISKKLAEKMNGSLTLTSELNVGSCFTLTLRDLEITKSEKAVNLDQEQAPFAHATILVVDDIETNRIILKKYLTAYPFKILLAENGRQAIELAISEKPDLILMDVRMPVMNGYEAANIIKQELDTLIVAVTASALDDRESADKREIFDDFLRKPILRKELIASLSKLLFRI